MNMQDRDVMKMHHMYDDVLNTLYVNGLNFQFHMLMNYMYHMIFYGIFEIYHKD